MYTLRQQLIINKKLYTPTGIHIICINKQDNNINKQWFDYENMV